MLRISSVVLSRNAYLDALRKLTINSQGKRYKVITTRQNFPRQHTNQP